MANRKAIAIVAYDRSHYFRFVVPSILEQRLNGGPLTDEYDIYIFQDGLCVTDERCDHVSHARLTRMARDFVSKNQCFIQNNNLGVALHFDFVERKLFQEKAYEFVLFCEDDLVLAPGYVEIIDRMARKFAGDQRVGMVSANPSDVTVSADKQASRLNEYAPMAHNWAFGLSREFWLKRQPMVDEYLELVRPQNYRARPQKAISSWLESKGFNALATSQDYVKQCATLRLGAARISTSFNLGLPIGRVGLHCKPEDFERMGFGRTVITPVIPSELADLTQERFKQIYENQAGPIRERPAHLPNGPGEASNPKPTTATPETPMPEASASTSTDDEEEREDAYDRLKERFPAIDDLPAMEVVGIERLVERLRDAGSYLEYGSGGSTALAAELGVPQIVSVESDKALLDKSIDTARSLNGDVNLTPHPVNIGPTGDWGRPIDKTASTNWPAYCSTAWTHYRDDSLPTPDVILIKGRFRVACFLVSMAFAKPGAGILFDDYFDRPHYHIVEKHFSPVDKAGRMAEFTVPTDVCATDLLVDVLLFSTNAD
ncbi:MAG: hypothetical protein AAF250_08310 [Pseudomonadota bacterium]